MRWISTIPSLLPLSFFLCAFQPLAAGSAHGDDILIADFEEGFGGWKVEGNAFGEGPVYQRRPQQNHVWRYLGGTYASSHNGGEDSTDKLQVSVVYHRTPLHQISFIGGGRANCGCRASGRVPERDNSWCRVTLIHNLNVKQLTSDRADRYTLINGART